MKKISRIIFGTFLVLALGLLCFSSNICADDATGNVSIENSPPTIGTVTLLNQVATDEAITLAVGSTVTVTASATVTDLNGGSTISSASATLYHSTSTSDGSDDENIHITNSSCTLGTADETNNRSVTCSFAMNYMTLPGTWTVNITAVDDNGSQVSGTDDNTVNELAGLEVVETNVNFGSLQLGEKSSTGTAMTIRSMGNIAIDARYKGTNYTCTVGTIPVENTKYGLANVAYDSLDYALTEGYVTMDEFNLGIRGVATNNGNNSEDTAYWGIQIPTSGVSGTCLNTLTVTAISN